MGKHNGKSRKLGLRVGSALANRHKVGAGFTPPHKCRNDRLQVTDAFKSNLEACPDEYDSAPSLQCPKPLMAIPSVLISSTRPESSV